MDQRSLAYRGLWIDGGVSPAVAYGVQTLDLRGERAPVPPRTVGGNTHMARTLAGNRPNTKRAYTPKIDQPIRWASISSAIRPSRELPDASSPGDHTAIDALPGATAKMPPPTPLLPGNPTR